MKFSGRVRDKASCDLLKKQLQGFAEGLPDNLLDLKTGRLSTKKQKREKTAEEVAVADIKKMWKKRLAMQVHQVLRPTSYNMNIREHPELCFKSGCSDSAFQLTQGGGTSWTTSRKS